MLHEVAPQPIAIMWVNTLSRRMRCGMPLLCPIIVEGESKPLRSYHVAYRLQDAYSLGSLLPIRSSRFPHGMA